MYNIAIVDDEPAVADQVFNMLTEYVTQKSIEIAVSRFESGDMFLQSDFKDTDIVFLDIEMPGTNGMNTAKKVRETKNNLIIIFCTNLAQYAVNGYEVGALGYLIKPVQSYPFNLYLEKAFKVLSAKKVDKIAVKTLHGQMILSTSEIIYTEVQKHNIFFYFQGKGGLETVKTRGSMSEMSDKLAGNGFARCSTSFLINLNYVISVENNTVFLPGVHLPVSRTHKKNFSESLMRFLMENEVARI